MVGFVLYALILGSASSTHAQENANAKSIEQFFYHKRDFGSDAYFNPVYSFINYSLDTLQIPRSFDDKNLDDRWSTVYENLTNPGEAIEKDGGVDHFIHTQVFPIHYDRLDESIELVPNYTRHMIGGGMVYRKNVEWFSAHDYSYPQLFAATLGMAAEVVQEVIEKKSTDSDDEIADVYIFRPLGMMLFSSDKVSRFFLEQFGLLEWPHTPMYNLRSGGFRNLGENYVVRPSFFGTTGSIKPFVYYGPVTLLGLSHKINAESSLSWGVGQAFIEADPLELRTSAGLFYDTEGSLMASAIVNGTENLALRVNIYPGVFVQSPLLPGLFIGVEDDGDVLLGVSIAYVPIGALWSGGNN